MNVRFLHEMSSCPVRHKMEEAFGWKTPIQYDHGTFQHFPDLFQIKQSFVLPHYDPLCNLIRLPMNERRFLRMVIRNNQSHWKKKGAQQWKLNWRWRSDIVFSHVYYTHEPNSGMLLHIWRIDCHYQRHEDGIVFVENWGCRYEGVPVDQSVRRYFIHYRKYRGKETMQLTIRLPKDLKNSINSEDSSSSDDSDVIPMANFSQCYGRVLPEERS